MRTKLWMAFSLQTAITITSALCAALLGFPLLAFSGPIAFALMTLGAIEGIATAFALGILLDLLTTTAPFGLYAFSLATSAWLVSLVPKALLQQPIFTYIAHLCLVASATALVETLINRGLYLPSLALDLGTGALLGMPLIWLLAKWRVVR